MGPDVEIVFAHEIKFAVLAHAEHGKSGRYVDHFAALAPGGRLAILGVHRDSRFSVDPFWMLNGEREVIGSRYVTRQDIVDSLELVRRGHIRPIVTRIFALEDAEQAHELLGQGAMIGRAALVMD